jgi:hypothetical protein
VENNKLVELKHPCNKISHLVCDDNSRLWVNHFNGLSVFDEKQERTITITSADALQGSVVGKFKFNEFIKVVENSFGSLYTNYKPNKVASGQYIKFNFKI